MTKSTWKPNDYAVIKGKGTVQGRAMAEALINDYTRLKNMVDRFITYSLIIEGEHTDCDTSCHWKSFYDNWRTLVAEARALVEKDVDAP